MPRTCTVCTSSQRPAIERALVAGESLRGIAERFGLSDTSVHRHKTDHLPARLARAHEAEDAAQADDLLAQVRALQARALGLLDKAEEAGDLRTALGGVREARGCLELLAKLTGELQQEGSINVLIAPEWLALRGALLAALAPYAEARTAVAAALLALEGSPDGARA